MVTQGPHIEPLPPEESRGEAPAVSVPVSTQHPLTETVEVAPYPAPGTEDYALQEATAGASVPAETAAPVESAAPPLPRFGRYDVRDRIGKGGMGLVFRAYDTQLEREVALKTIREGLFADGQEVERFLNEARAIAKLHHPNIVPIYEIGQEEGRHFFTMRLASGGSLGDHLAEFSQTDPRRGVELMEKIARAVHCAHERHILHRDLKPANILLDDKNEPMVSDFGLVKFLDQDREMTQGGKAVGTRPYMSPEQLGGLKEKISPRTDIWALGVVLYELLTSKRPFDSPSEEELSRLIQNVDPLSPRKHRGLLDKRLETIVLKCLRKNPAERYATAFDLGDDLKSWLEEKPIRAKPEPWLSRAMRRIRQRPILGLPVVLVMLIVAGVFMANGPTEAERWTRSVQKQLNQGKTVTLIGPTGGPKWSRWAWGTRKNLPESEEDKPYNLSTWELALLELVPNPGIDSYRFRAEVRHHGAVDGMQQVGLYLGQNRQPTPKGWANIFLELTFTDRFLQDARQKRGNAIHLRGCLLREPLGDSGFEIFYNSKAAFYDAHLKDKDRPWRQIAVDVLPDRITPFWEGKPISDPITWEKMNSTSNRSLSALIRNTGNRDDLKPVNINFGPLDGLGLYVAASDAEFRNVVIEPIDLK